MHKVITLPFLAGILSMNLTACAEMATLPVDAGTGPKPKVFPGLDFLGRCLVNQAGRSE